MLDVRLTNGQRISQIAVVSEAYVLEFFKQFGEYETTKFAEFVDEFEDNSVYFAETAIFPHATEASIKVQRIHTMDLIHKNVYLIQNFYFSLQKQKVKIQLCGYMV